MKMEIFINQAGCTSAVERKGQVCPHHPIESVELVFEVDVVSSPHFGQRTFVRVFADGTMDIRGLNTSAFGYKATLDEWAEGLMALVRSGRALE